MVRYRTPLTTRQVDIPPSHPASGHKLLKFPTRNQYILEVRTQNPLVIQAEGEYLRVDSAVTCPYSPVFRHSIESMPPYLLFTAACRGLEVNDAAQDLYHLFRFMFEGHYRPQTADESLITLGMCERYKIQALVPRSASSRLLLASERHLLSPYQCTLRSQETTGLFYHP